jgi:hypothetical protein
MKAILILAGPYSSCKATQLVWQKLCDDKDIKLKILDLTNHDGQEFSTKLNIKSFPAFIIDNKVVAVGHPSEQTAETVKNIFNR